MDYVMLMGHLTNKMYKRLYFFASMLITKFLKFILITWGGCQQDLVGKW